MYSLTVLGFWLSRNVFSLGRKALAKLLGTELPTTDRGLLQLLGCLNFAGQFVTDYKRKVRDLYALTCKTSNGRWTSGHTELLNDIADEICNRLELGLVDMS